MLRAKKMIGECIEPSSDMMIVHSWNRNMSWGPQAPLIVRSVVKPLFEMVTGVIKAPVVLND